MRPLKVVALRNKSPVHNYLIERSGRRDNDPTMRVKQAIEFPEAEKVWEYPGKVIESKPKRVILKDIIKLKKTNVKDVFDVLVLGPGQGAEVLYLKEIFKDTKNNIDTLGLTNNLSEEANQAIRKDYSPKKLKDETIFENISHLNLVRKYDYIYSHEGPLEHSVNPEIVMLKTASMLRIGGFARFLNSTLEHYDLRKYVKNCEKYLIAQGYENAIKFKVIANSLIIVRLK